MSKQINSVVVYGNILKMFEYRNVKLKGVAMQQDDLLKQLNSAEYIVIEGRYDDKFADRAGTRLICILVSERSSYADQAPLYRKLLRNVPAEKCNAVIVTPNDYLSTHVSKVHAEYIADNPGVYLEHVGYKIFMHEVPAHVYVPKHRLLTDDEVADLERRFYIKRSYLPKIKSTDAAAVWWGARVGQVVEIEQLNASVGTTINWRYCEK